MVNEQPEALRLAEWIEGDMTCQGDAEIAAELRRLHEINSELCRKANTLTILSARDEDKITALEASNQELVKALEEMLDGEGSSFRVLCEQARAAINKAERTT